ncbi:hypothetical protein N7508_003944 [Penicillium antarcticum]|uniref:uncharacterized protein n=1 Tax=Penicillium antarcticum TaxID=416450 RepID=UPI002390BDC9|nr:uncharacterized protein N7508_003944 [Penicillium antarcticum]KAJ5313114.1 hypothetical protein N7508_003944 [Penicillium antarcticum]
MAGNIDTNNDIYRLTARPFILEREGEYDRAIKVYQNAVEILCMSIEKFKKMNVRRVNRKMFERQVQVHRDRLAYLQTLKRKGSFDGIVLPPTILDAMEDLAVKDGDSSPWTLSQMRQALHTYRSMTDENNSTSAKEVPHHLKPILEASDSTQIPFFSPSLATTAEPLTYRITHDSEFVELGARSHWLFVKDATNTHVLYALQAIWSDQIPITEAVLRRPGEFLPRVGAVSVRIRKTPGGSFRLVTSTVPDIGIIVEIPDREAKSKDWSPRRFQYGGRNFVWRSGRKDSREKSADGGLFKSFAWEALYETKRVWPKQGSQTGKLEDETVGMCLCWGEKGGGNGAAHSIYMNPGLDMHFREHLLAAQLARFVRCKNPPHKDSKGVEAVATGQTILSILEMASS